MIVFQLIVIIWLICCLFLSVGTLFVSIEGGDSFPLAVKYGINCFLVMFFIMPFIFIIGLFEE